MTFQQLKYVIEITDAGSMNEAAKRLFISQPSMSEAVKELEKELGFEIFFRNNRGILLTPDGKEFIGYARQVMDQYGILSDRFISNKIKKKFSVSMQHYSFAVQAFINVVEQYGVDAFEFAAYECKTREVIENVKLLRSEIGVLYINDFNEKVISKLLKDSDIKFHELFECDIFVYIASSHPLADRKMISLDDLIDYPCLAFDQGEGSSMFFAEEQLSTLDHSRIIYANDRATMLNLMTGLNGYTLCSGIISEDLNGEGYEAIPLKESEKMRIGYIRRTNSKLSEIGEKYVSELKKYREKAYIK